VTELLDAGDPELIPKLNAMTVGHFPERIGYEVLSVGVRSIATRIDVTRELWGPNKILHGGVIVTLADTTCGYGARLYLPEGATGFATLELKVNYLRPVTDGGARCDAQIVHVGRTTQVWDATVSVEESGKPIALVRCTQSVLWPSPGNRTSS
jgi:1,4-dihydroxy-2-naphthoyl-CoA hydrolase